MAKQGTIQPSSQLFDLSKRGFLLDLLQLCLFLKACTHHQFLAARGVGVEAFTGFDA